MAINNTKRLLDILVGFLLFYFFGIPLLGVPVSFGQTVSGTITAGKEETYTFSATAGNKVLIRMSTTSGDLCPYIRLLNPAGKAIGNSWGFTNAEVKSISLPSIGTYTIIAGDYDGSYSGTYNLTLERLNPGTGATVSFGQTKSGNLAVGDLDSHVFSASAGNKVIIRMSTTSGYLSPYIRLFDPAGTEIGNSWGFTNAEVKSISLPSTGTYTIIAGDYDGSYSGTYNLTLERLNPGTGSAIWLGQTKSGNLVIGDLDSHVFSASAGNKVIIRMSTTSGNLWSYIRLFDPAGTEIGNSSGTSNAEIISISLPSTGTYTIIAADYYGNYSGGYKLTFERPGPPKISVNRASLNFGYIIGSSNMPQETFTIYNNGGGALNWSASTVVENISLSPTSGTNFGVVEVTINPVGLLPAKYEGVIYVTAPLASNSPVEVKINLCVKQQASPPFGEFSTPLDGSTVYSSIPVTGWAIGDTGIDSVKIYREEGSNLVYIGDAIIVEGARPDVEAAYPDYPMNYKAGWGYMMLTNFLPNGGNGVFKIHAVAADKEGLTADLGTKTITVVNSLAAKPFGAIDTPAPGGTATGTNHRNQGWVLTPRPNKIPENGSTINIYVDGKYLGHPIYNIYRGDIAQLFPEYANSNGSHGYFDFDTTAYENGIHTIYWTATDNAGNSDGIGSRYFTIQNTGATAGCISQSAAAIAVPLDIDLSAIPVDYSEGVKILSGFTEAPDTPEMYPGENGIIEIEIKELERIEIHFTQAREDAPLLNYTGYLVVNDQLRPLPIGSTLDSQRGIFYWQPGVGFYGDYELVFIKQNNTGRNAVRVKVRILPKYKF